MTSGRRARHQLSHPGRCNVTVRDRERSARMRTRVWRQVGRAGSVRAGCPFSAGWLVQGRLRSLNQYRHWWHRPASVPHGRPHRRRSTAAALWACSVKRWHGYRGAGTTLLARRPEGSYRPQQRLDLVPVPQGHGSLRPGLIRTVRRRSRSSLPRSRSIAQRTSCGSGATFPST